MAVREITHRQYEKLEPEWSALPEDEQPRLVVYFGMLGYKVVAACDTQAEAEEVLACWQVAATIFGIAGQPNPDRRGLSGKGLPVPGWTRAALPSDFDIRTQADLDAVTKAILESYR